MNENNEKLQTIVDHFNDRMFDFEGIGGNLHDSSFGLHESSYVLGESKGKYKVEVGIGINYEDALKCKGSRRDTFQIPSLSMPDFLTKALEEYDLKASFDILIPNQNNRAFYDSILKGLSIRDSILSCHILGDTVYDVHGPDTSLPKTSEYMGSLDESTRNKLLSITDGVPAKNVIDLGIDLYMLDNDM
jgi:hypothetical protein